MPNEEERFSPAGGTGFGGAGRAGTGGRRQGRRGSGPGAECVCPVCGAKAPHLRGIPCRDVACPKCGAAMSRP